MIGSILITCFFACVYWVMAGDCPAKYPAELAFVACVIFGAMLLVMTPLMLVMNAYVWIDTDANGKPVSNSGFLWWHWTILGVLLILLIGAIGLAYVV